MNTIKKFKKYSNLKNTLTKRKEEIALINKTLEYYKKNTANKKDKKQFTIRVLFLFCFLIFCSFKLSLNFTMFYFLLAPFLFLAFFGFLCDSLDDKKNVDFIVENINHYKVKNKEELILEFKKILSKYEEEKKEYNLIKEQFSKEEINQLDHNKELNSKEIFYIKELATINKVKLLTSGSVFKNDENIKQKRKIESYINNVKGENLGDEKIIELQELLNEYNKIEHKIENE